MSDNEFVNKNSKAEEVNTEPLPEVKEKTESNNSTKQSGYSYTGTDPQTPDLEKPKKKVSKRLIGEIVGGVLLVIFMFSSAGRVSASKYNDLKEKYDALAASNSEKEAELKDLSEVKTEYEDYKEKMAPYEKLDAAEAEARQIQADKVAADKKAAEEKAAADKKAAEEKAAADAAAAKAAEEARGYETGITYDQLARTPDDFKGQKVKFYGRVVQVMEDTGSTQIRLATDDNSDTMLYCEYDPSIVPSRILEDDYITIYGTSAGTITYQSTMGGNITIPGISVDKIDQ
ncbi:toxin regulator [Clostridioides difficile]|nr:toxin regulator [Clostridioides difficile]